MTQPAIPRSRRNRDLDRMIGQRLRDVRLSSGVSQEELAQRLGIERVSLSRYETGQRAIPFSALLAISDILQRPISDFALGTTLATKRRPLLETVPKATGVVLIDSILATLTQHPQLAAGVQQFLDAMLSDTEAT
jgi:transcriptional regulator with XRE-family HTH domain